MAKSIYTDLAMESRELNPGISGVSETSEKLEGIAITRIRVEDQQASEKLGKPQGLYVTLDAPDLTSRPLDLFERLSKSLSTELTNLLKDVKEDATILVVGLGNRGITSDSLGPKVVEQVYVTRHITQYMPDALSKPMRAVCAMAPGVLGVTGIETMEVVQGALEHIKPSLIIAIDSLASRRAERISTTIQLTDTGISPGSGVGNLRKGLDSKTFGVPVIAIGVPLVVQAATISQEVITLLANETGLPQDEDRLKSLTGKVISEHMGDMVVTPKDIDTIVTDVSRIIADGINLALFGMKYEEVRSLVA